MEKQVEYALYSARSAKGSTSVIAIRLLRTKSQSHITRKMRAYEGGINDLFVLTVESSYSGKDLVRQSARINAIDWINGKREIEQIKGD